MMVNAMNVATHIPITMDIEMGVLPADDGDDDDDGIGDVTEGGVVIVTEVNGARAGAVASTELIEAVLSKTKVVGVEAAVAVTPPLTPARPVGIAKGSELACCRRCRYCGTK
jgi:hypothetical protein